MTPITKIAGSLRPKQRGLSIIAISSMVLVIAFVISLWSLNHGSDYTPDPNTIFFEASVPQEIQITENFSGFTANGTPLDLSGTTIELAFRGGYLEAIYLPLSYSSGQSLASFSDAGAGIYLEQDNSGQRTLRFPLISTQEGITLVVTGTVVSIQPQDDGSKTRVSLSRMEARADLPATRAHADEVLSVSQFQLVFELNRLPMDARLTMRRVSDFDISTRSSIDSALDEMKGPWTTALAVEASRINLENGTDIGEAFLYITLPNMNQKSLNSLVAVHVNDDGHAERLVSEVFSTTEDETGVRFISPRGLSIFTVMVPSLVLEATAAPTTASIATSSPPPSPSASADLSPTPTNEAPPTALARPTPTPSSTSVATLPTTQSATVTLQPSPTPATNPSPTAGTSPVPSAIPTPTPSSTPTHTPLPPPTPIPTSTSTDPPSSTPTSTSIPVDADLYGVILHTLDPAEQQWFMDIVGTNWFLDWTSTVEDLPNGHEKPISIMSLPGPSTQRIQELAALAPGSIWYIVGEPNRRAGYGAGDIVTQLHDLYSDIKTADPTAKITSPSILNWEFTCKGCAGYPYGSLWLDEFRTAYLTQYGEEPPIDIWAIDVYHLDWTNLPTVDHQLVIDQISGLRQYLDAAGHQGDPIWITELGLHWGWDGMLFSIDEEYDSSCDPYPQPTGTYQTDQVIGYLDEVFDWLDANAASQNIEKWFLLSTYYDINTCNSGSYAGLTLFDGPVVGASLTEVGQFFRDRVLGISP